MANPDRAREQNRAGAARSFARTKAEIRAFVIGMKSRPCMDCRQSFDPICMDFDHRLDEIKAGNVSQMRTLDEVKAEVAKCDVVCSNCHRLRTKKRGQWGRKRKTAPPVPSNQLQLMKEQP